VPLTVLLLEHVSPFAVDVATQVREKLPDTWREYCELFSRKDDPLYHPYETSGNPPSDEQLYTVRPLTGWLPVDELIVTFVGHPGRED
jgi:hypothetical protein